MGCLKHGQLELAANLVKDFAGGRRNSNMVPLDTVRAVVEALGAAGSEGPGQDLLESLRRKNIPTAQLSQIQSAFTEATKRGAVGGVANAASTDFVSALGASRANCAPQQSVLPSYALGMIFLQPVRTQSRTRTNVCHLTCLERVWNIIRPTILVPTCIPLQRTTATPSAHWLTMRPQTAYQYTTTHPLSRTPTQKGPPRVQMHQRGAIRCSLYKASPPQHRQVHL